MDGNYNVEHAVKLILTAMGGFAYRGRQPRIAYASLQSRFPQKFSTPADGLYFSWWLSDIDESLRVLVEKDEAQEIIWFPPEKKPPHRTYFLRSRPTGTQDDICARLGEYKYILPEVLSISFMHPGLGQGWLFLLEEYYAYLNADKPSLDYWRYRHKTKDADEEAFCRKREPLARDLKSGDYKSIQFGEMATFKGSAQQEEKPAECLYYFLPSQLSGGQKKSFLRFYKGLEHVDISKGSNGDEYQIKFHLPKDVISRAHEAYLDEGLTVDLVERWYGKVHNEMSSFTDLVNYHQSQIATNNKRYRPGGRTETTLRKLQDDRVNFATELAPDIQKKVFDKVRYQAEVLYKYREVLQERLVDLSTFLVMAALATQSEPLSLRFIDTLGVRIDPKTKETGDPRLELGQVTNLELEFSPKFDEVFRRALKGRDTDLQRGATRHYTNLLFRPDMVAQALMAGKKSIVEKGGVFIV